MLTLKNRFTLWCRRRSVAAPAARIIECEAQLRYWRSELLKAERDLRDAQQDQAIAEWGIAANAVPKAERIKPQS